MSASDLDNTEPPQLAAMLSIDPAGGRVWEDVELAAILSHQLAAPLECDSPHATARIERAAEFVESGNLRPAETWHQLLHQPTPALEKLEFAKRFAKACRNEPIAPLPKEVATVIYFACIVAARLRCNDARISALSDAALADGLRWAAAQPWVDQTTRALLEQGIAHVTK